ncbi:gluconokinase [Olivibacter sp. XZL3]|uniref:gluconokinase n=1 Tax=Olivibacter sp. XZL3 TaxID=1735116 RepID=UPI0010666534|nr:gluconokinase [Olivibacter sp. XZL3]
MDYVIAVDIGTTSTKALAFGLRGQVLAEHRISYSIISPLPAYSEQDPEVLFDAVVNAIREVSQMMDKSSIKGSVLGVSFSSAMHGLLAVDKEGKPLSNCIIWADTRSERFATQLKGTALGHDIYLKTGTPIHPMSPLCKLGWMKENRTDIFDSAHKFISIKEYVFFKLFGRYLIDVSIASATGLLETDKQQWYGPALSLVGISSDQLSALVPITYTLRGLDVYYANLMQLPADLPFIIGGSDGCLANIGAQATRPGVASVTIGTSGAIRVVSAKPARDAKERIFSYVISADMFVLGGAVNNGGNILQWFQEGFISSDGQALEEAIPLLTKKAASVAPGANGLVFLPYLSGERAPHWDAKAKGVFFGVQMQHTQAHFIRAMMEGILFGLYSVGKALEDTSGPIDRIFVSGGFAKSEDWIQMLADVFNKHVLVRKTVESSAMGAAIVGMNALQIIEGFELYNDQDVTISSFVPKPANHAVYIENFKLFERLYTKLKDEF